MDGGMTEQSGVHSRIQRGLQSHLAPPHTPAQPTEAPDHMALLQAYAAPPPESKLLHEMNHAAEGLEAAVAEPSPVASAGVQEEELLAAAMRRKGFEGPLSPEQRQQFIDEETRIQKLKEELVLLETDPVAYARQKAEEYKELSAVPTVQSEATAKRDPLGVYGDEIRKMAQPYHQAAAEAKANGTFPKMPGNDPTPQQSAQPVNPATRQPGRSLPPVGRQESNQGMSDLRAQASSPQPQPTRPRPPAPPKPGGNLHSYPAGGPEDTDIDFNKGLNAPTTIGNPRPSGPPAPATYAQRAGAQVAGVGEGLKDMLPKGSTPLEAIRSVTVDPIVDGIHGMIAAPAKLAGQVMASIDDRGNSQVRSAQHQTELDRSRARDMTGPAVTTGLGMAGRGAVRAGEAAGASGAESFVSGMRPKAPKVGPEVPPLQASFPAPIKPGRSTTYNMKDPRTTGPQGPKPAQPKADAKPGGLTQSSGSASTPKKGTGLKGTKVSGEVSEVKRGGAQLVGQAPPKPVGPARTATNPKELPSAKPKGVKPSGNLPPTTRAKPGADVSKVKPREPVQGPREPSYNMRREQARSEAELKLRTNPPPEIVRRMTPEQIEAREARKRSPGGPANEPVAEKPKKKSEAPKTEVKKKPASKKADEKKK